MQKLFMLKEYIDRLATEYGIEWVLEDDDDFCLTLHQTITIRLGDEGYEFRTKATDWAALESVSHLKKLL